MSVYSVEGKLGTGKTKFAVMQAQKALLSNRRVASNVDLKTNLLTPYKRSHFVRIPDKPLASDLENIGHGNPGTYNEDMNGVLILDELGTWLNSRSFQDPQRMPVIDWLIHARKHGWDVYLIVQDAGMIDKQVREALIEYQCRCMNLSKIRVPIIGNLLGLISPAWGYLPKVHTVTARTGYGQNAIVAEKWMYRGTDLHAAFDTRQIFTNARNFGVHSVLPPWDWHPKPLPFAFAKKIISGIFKPTPTLRPRPQLSKKPQIMQAIQKLPADRRIPFIKKTRFYLTE